MEHLTVNCTPPNPPDQMPSLVRCSINHNQQQFFPRLHQPTTNIKSPMFRIFTAVHLTKSQVVCCCGVVKKEKLQWLKRFLGIR